MYNNKTVGVLKVKTPISDYVHRIKTYDGKYNNVVLEKTLQSIVANSVVSNHLFRLFTPIRSEGIYTVVSDIMDVLCIKDICINEDTIELICIMIDNEVKKVLRYVYGFDETQVQNCGLGVTIDTIRTDLQYIIK